MQTKKGLKGANMWIMNDLMMYRWNLAYLARWAVKGGYATQTGVTEGKVFVKKTAKDKPQKINSAQDIQDTKTLSRNYFLLRKALRQ